MRGFLIMKSIAFLLVILMALSSIEAGAATKKESKTKFKKSAQIAPKYVIAIDYPSADVALNAITARPDIAVKANASVINNDLYSKIICTAVVLFKINFNTATFRKFDCIVHDVRNQLKQSCSVANNKLWQFVITIDNKI